MIRASDPPMNERGFQIGFAELTESILCSFNVGQNNPIWSKITHMVENVKRGDGVLFGAQIRAARALLRWSAEDLAEASAVGANTVRRAEAADGLTSMTAANQRAIRQALENAGVQFIDENGGGPGVRLRKPTR
jgi:hypothetical protein